MLSDGCRMTSIMCKLLLAVVFWCDVRGVPTEAVSSRNEQKVLLISMDGFRHDYFKKANTPNFDAMMATGVTVPDVVPSFPPMTFPVHTSIVTGLFAESHGIVENNFYDPHLNKTFNMSKVDYEWWNESEPFWITAVKSGLKAGAFAWPGSAVNFDGHRPHAYRDYDSKYHEDVIIKTVVDWLSVMDLDMVAAYFEEPDLVGHNLGPEDPGLIPAIERMDTMLGLLVSSLENVGIKDKVDIIITSDHGMATVDLQNRAINISEHVNDSLIRRSVPGAGAILNLIPQPNKSRELVEALSKVKHVNVFLREDVPKRFHYSNNPRIADVVAYADEGWIMANGLEKADLPKLRGTHGFDNNLMSMRTIFVASGPSFKKGYRLPSSIESVDIYPLLCHLLDVEPVPNNGSFLRMEPLLMVSTDQALVVKPSLIITLIVLVIAKAI